MHTELRIYNTLSRKKELFETIEPGKVRMYVCGVTPYAPAHAGHAMSAIVFDVIRRYLEHAGYEVRYATNFTDIEDKIIARASREQVDPGDLAEHLIAEWQDEMRALNIKPATLYPRATEEIPAIVKTIQGLIDKGFAYPVDGDVYYRVRSFEEYGKLSRRDPDELLSGARVEVDERKEDPLDFALWKAAKPGEPSWPSPWSSGRPGWHIECSAMVSNHLNGVIDIHGGGTDLIFPHHENEIAQSEAYLGTAPFARYWVHNGLLQLGSDKMSKSIGNIVPAKDLLARGLGPAFRLMVLQSHYRAPLSFNEEGLDAAARGLDRLITAARPIDPMASESIDHASEDLAGLVDDVDRRFHEAMNDDFDTPVAVAAIFDLARAVNRVKSTGVGSASAEPARRMLISLADVLGLDLSDAVESSAGNAGPFIELLILVRNELRDAKQWSLADQIRNRLRDMGISIEDAATGTTWRRIDR